MNTYSETIRALKDFHDAKEALVCAEKAWDDLRRYLFPDGGGEGSFSHFYPVNSDFVEKTARGFLHAYNAYQNLGYPKRKTAMTPGEEDSWLNALRTGCVLPFEDDNE